MTNSKYIKHSALSKVRLAIFLFFIGIISPNTSWANDFAPPCDTIVLVSGEKIVATILTQTDSELTIENCENQISQTLLWNNIEDIRRWVKPKIAKQKLATKKETKVRESNVFKETHQLKQLRKSIKTAKKSSLPSRKEVLDKMNWKVALSIGNMAFTDRWTIDTEFAKQGFSTNEPEGWFDFVAYDRIPRHRAFVALDIKRKVNPKMFIGIKSTLSSQRIYAYKSSDYTVPSPQHSIRTHISYASIDPVVEWVSLEDPISFYAGPSFTLLDDHRFDNLKLNLGLLAGLGFTWYSKKPNRPLFRRLFIEFNLQENYWFKGETVESINYNDEVISNTFRGVHLSFSHIKIGVERGFTIKNKNK